MKKINYLLLFLTLFLFNTSFIKASSNSMDSLSIDVYVSDGGTATITEVWDMDLYSGTEMYKPMTNLGNSSIRNFTVTENGNVYSYENNWNTSDSLVNKKNKNGINRISDGLELCWGIGSYGHHTYTIKYDVTNFVYNLTDDNQVIYWKLVNDSMNPAPRRIQVTVHSDFSYDLNQVGIWGFGYEGTDVINNGKIEMNSTNFSSSNYVVLLAKFNPNTFETTNRLNKSFEQVRKMAMKGTKSFADIIFGIFSFICSILPFIFVIIFAAIKSDKYSNYKFGKNGRKIDKDINYFRDIPCKKDIFRAYFIACIYRLNKKETDFLGTILLKWVKEDKIKIEKLEDKMFSKNNYRIDLTGNIETDNKLELKLYNMLKEASKDGYLDSNEFSKWCSKNYDEILGWFDQVIEYERGILISEGLITVESKGIFGKENYIVNEKLKEEAIELAGLKKFLQEFTRINDREYLEVKLFDEYLMFAQIFGIADKVASQFKKLYPDVITDLRYDDYIMINTFYYSGISRAEASRSAAHGGGGSSFIGGGGGSFGGGSGGGAR